LLQDFLAINSTKRILNRFYTPIALQSEAGENQAIRAPVLDLLRGNIDLKTHTALFPGDADFSKEFHDALLAILKGERALTIDKPPHTDIKSNSL
jgi:hypothetical protein